MMASPSGRAGVAGSSFGFGGEPVFEVVFEAAFGVDLRVRFFGVSVVSLAFGMETGLSSTTVTRRLLLSLNTL